MLAFRFFILELKLFIIQKSALLKKSRLQPKEGFRSTFPITPRTKRRCCGGEGTVAEL